MLTEAPRFPGAWLAAAVVALPLCGCHALYLATGQLEVNARRQPVAELLRRDDLDATLRARLEYARRARDFAVGALALPDNASYRNYADLGRPFATWNVFAAPEFSVEPRRWCWPIAGCVAYRGYFAEHRARRAAARLVRHGYDVHIAPAAAWSTLGYFSDPVLNTMLGQDDVALAATLFHELAHQVAWIPGDNDLSEAFATVVEIEGTRRWLRQVGQPGELEAWLATRRRQHHYAGIMLETRERLARLYADPAGGDGLRRGKAAEFSRLRAELGALGAAVPDVLNNAVLAVVSAYDRCVPPLTAELERAGGELPAFYAEVRRAAQDAALRARLCPDQRPARSR